MNDPYIPSTPVDNNNSPITEATPSSEPSAVTEPCQISTCGCSTSHKIAKRTLMGVAITLIAFNGALYASPQLGAQIANWIPDSVGFPSNPVVGHSRGCGCEHSLKMSSDASADQLSESTSLSAEMK